MTEFSHDERERLYELTSIGASHASMAFTLLLHRAVASGVPHFVDLDEYTADDAWETGVIFQADGELTGLVAILLPAHSCDIVSERLVDDGDSEDHEHVIESALRELGNIVASHTMSSIADRLGGRILLSVPVLVMEEADSAFVSMLRERGADHFVECELTDADSEIHVRLIFAPESKSSGDVGEYSAAE
ncbi:MAG: chemotaxis protein CheC [Deltaproteobacteria bacterium]|jgi:chemotaxis protein CheY-P-specific phosphatase CheC|nr:chemotaxis protein CheC [Deltaproteobacteria bacterium]MBW2542290.1 chemotaxis protein CheC [Deltaproteobacteria bacterium]